jgi:hypothetical protein
MTLEFKSMLKDTPSFEDVEESSAILTLVFRVCFIRVDGELHPHLQSRARFISMSSTYNNDVIARIACSSQKVQTMT